MARGDISASPGNGKRIDRLPYEVVQVDGFEPVRLTVDVFMKKRFEHSEASPKPVSGASFVLLCEGESVEGSDIDACISAIRSKLDKRFQIKWKPWVKVSIERERQYMASGGTGLSLRWENVERGKAFDGSDLMRTYYGHNGKTWKIEPWPQYFKDKHGRTLACIERTDDNIAALELFRDKIDEMRKALADFVSPDQIEETLRQISTGGMTLLPST
ncbi:MAG: hypothetical protein AAFN44_11525 [Pseudomonadota bacterium]